MPWDDELESRTSTVIETFGHARGGAHTKTFATTPRLVPKPRARLLRSSTRLGVWRFRSRPTRPIAHSPR